MKRSSSSSSSSNDAKNNVTRSTVSLNNQDTDGYLDNNNKSNNDTIQDCEVGLVSVYCGDMPPTTLLTNGNNDDSSDEEEEVEENQSLEDISLEDDDSSYDTENPFDSLSEDSSEGDESLDRRDVLESLQDLVVMGLMGGTEEGYGGSDSSIAELVDVLRTIIGDEDLSHLPPRIRRRVKDFHFAQKERSKLQKFQSKGIISLFANLSDIRSDLRWAEDAAWRRENGMPYVSWSDFEAKRRRGLQRPYMTYCLTFVYIILMVVCFGANGWKVEPMKVNPFIGPSPETLLRMGALNTQTMIKTGSWYRILSATFLHGGIIHVVFNSAAMIFLGGMIECNHGILSTMVLFFVPAIGASILSALMQPEYTMVGASGGLFALIGICLADIFLNWKLLFLVFKNRGEDSGCWKKFRCIFWIVLDLFFQTLIGLTPFVDNFAHLGGLIYGFLLGLTMLERLPLAFFGEGSRRWKLASYRLFGITTTTVCLVLSSVLLSQSDGFQAPCYSCRSISCAPFPFWSEEKWWECDWCNYVEGDVIKTRGDEYYSELVLMCPNGKVAHTDILDAKYSDMADIAEDLPDYCRKICR